MPFFIRLRNVANSVDNRLIKEAVILGLHRSRNYKKNSKTIQCIKSRNYNVIGDK